MCENEGVYVCDIVRGSDRELKCENEGVHLCDIVRGSVRLCVRVRICVYVWGRMMEIC